MNIKAFIVALILFCLLPAKAQAESVAGTSLKNATVNITHGTGSVVKAKSGTLFVITNFHVCGADDELSWRYSDGTAEHGPHVYSDYRYDLCLFKVTTSNRKALTVAEHFSVKDALYTRGYPDGELKSFAGYVLQLASNWSFNYPRQYFYNEGQCPTGLKNVDNSDGSWYGCEVTVPNSITNLYARPGSSGSPVVNDNGELVGVVESYFPDNTAGIVPFYAVKAFLDAH